METSQVAPRSGKGWRCWTARILALLWGLYWVWFGVSVWGLGQARGAGLVMAVAWPGLVFLVSAIVAWRWQTVGAIVLLAEGALTAIAYPLAARNMPVRTLVFLLLLMSLPPLVAGALFLVSRRRQ